MRELQSGLILRVTEVHPQCAELVGLKLLDQTLRFIQSFPMLVRKLLLELRKECLGTLEVLQRRFEVVPVILILNDAQVPKCESQTLQFSFVSRHLRVEVHQPLQGHLRLQEM